MSLVTGDGPMTVSPGRPLLSEILQQQIGKGFTIVRDELHISVGKRQQMVFQPVATTLVELLEERRSPGSIGHLIAVVEEGVGIRRMGTLKGILNMLQIVGHSLTVEMVDDQSFTSGSCTLHLHHTVFDIQHHNGLASVLATQQFAVCLGGLPVQDAILHAVRDIFDRTVMPEKHRLMEYGILAVSLLSRPQVHILHFISNERLFHEYSPAGTLL